MISTLALLSLIGLVRAAYDYDVVVYGATPGGIMAAVSVGRSKLKVALVHETTHLGGMVSGGLGHSDVGSTKGIGGMSYEFFSSVGAIYGKDTPVWDFESHVASDVFGSFIANVSEYLDVFVDEPISSVSKSGGVVQSITTTTGKVFEAKAFLDGSYNGDLLPLAGISTAWGRESSSQYNESFAGRLNAPNSIGDHQFYSPVTHTYPNGSFYPMIQASESSLPPAGSADGKVQAYNFRMCLTTDSSNKIPLPDPPSYRSENWILFAKFFNETVDKSTAKLSDFLIISGLPNGKTDINNHGPISTDFIGGSWKYPTANYEERAQIFEAHKNYTLELFYFLRTDPSVPESVRSDMAQYGYAADEFVQSGGFPPQLYVRAGRRMVGDAVFTQADRMENLTKNDSVGVGNYNIDTHNAERFSHNASWVYNEGDIEQGASKGPFQIGYRYLLPKQSQAINVLAPVPVSASHVGFGAIRLEPTWMILGQSAGVAAAQAINDQNGNVNFHTLNVPKLQTTLRSLGQIIDLN